MKRGSDADRQDKVLAYLSQPGNWEGDATRFDILETHIAVVFLVGSRAFKMKKSIDIGYLDFTSLNRRRHILERELILNRPHAPGLYLRVVPVTERAGGGYELDGPGEAVEYLLEMNRFEQDQMFSHMADHGALDLELAVPLARKVSAMHRSAHCCRIQGWRESFGGIIASNKTQLNAAAAAGLIDAGMVSRLHGECMNAFHRGSEHLERRARGGWVRSCHGDLHLDNIVLLDGAPVPFDCIEFSDEFACIDTMYDIAFLLMDLRFRKLMPFASRLFNAYLADQREQDFEAALEAMALMPLYVAVRAGIRAHVSAQTAVAARKKDRKDKADRLLDQAHAYVKQALDCLEIQQPCLLAVGGLSGSGKSTLARGLAPEAQCVAGAVVLRSDEVRKRYFGVPMHEPLPSNAYRPEVSIMVYARMLCEASILLDAGQSVILDAVFALPDQRNDAQDLAREIGVPFWGFWLETETDVLTRRVDARRNDASDATAAVVKRQMALDVGDIGWIRLDAGRSAEAVLAEALSYIGK